MRDLAKWLVVALVASLAIGGGDMLLIADCSPAFAAMKLNDEVSVNV